MDKKWIMGSFIGCIVLWALTFTALANETPVSRLEGIVVTASRSAAALREVTSNITVISQDQINASTSDNIGELMAQNGFFTVDQGTQKLVQIRGMQQPGMQNELQSPVLVLLNGRRIGANNVNLMGLANVERVEIIRGPSAVQYGPSAMGGVINVITKRGVEDTFNATAEAGLGSFGLHKQSLALNGGLNGVDFALGVINFGRDDFYMHDGKKRPKSAIDFNTNVNFDLGYNFNDVNRVGLNLNYYGTDAQSGPTYSNRETYTWWNEYELSNYNLAFMYDGGTLDRLFNWSATYSFGQDRSKGHDTPVMSWKNDNKLDVQNANIQAGYNGDMLSVDIGFDYIGYDFRNKSLSDVTEGKSDDYGVYLASKLRFFEQRLIFSLGGRYDHYETSVSGPGKSDREDRFSPSVGMAFLPVDWLKLRANYAQGFKMAAPDQINASGWYIPNYNLKPEKSKTWEVGADVNWQFIDASLTYFYTDWKDKIIALATNTGLYQYQNLKAATISGLEFAFSANVGQAFNWQWEARPYVNFTYMIDRENKDPSTRSDSKIIPNVPDWMVNFGLTLANVEYDFKANLNAVYSGEVKSKDYRYGSGTNGQFINHTGDLVVNLSVEKGLFDIGDYGSLKLRANINNIFDSNNEAYLDYPGPGRNFYVGLVYSY